MGAVKYSMGHILYIVTEQGKFRGKGYIDAL